MCSATPFDRSKFHTQPRHYHCILVTYRIRRHCINITKLLIVPGIINHHSIGMHWFRLERVCCLYPSMLILPTKPRSFWKNYIPPELLAQMIYPIRICQCGEHVGENRLRKLCIRCMTALLASVANLNLAGLILIFRCKVLQIIP